MNVKDLSREQLIELKEHYYMFNKFDEEIDASYYELALIDELVTDEEIFDYYSSTTFSNDDFFCTCGLENVYTK